MGIHVRWPFEVVERPSARLRGKSFSPCAYGALDERFHFWTGESGRRYVCTVFAAGDTALDGLDLTHAVVIAVERLRDGNCRALSLVPSTLPLRLHSSAGNWLGSRTPNEFHVHLLPSDRNERDRAYFDLQRGFTRYR